MVKRQDTSFCRINVFRPAKTRKYYFVVSAFWCLLKYRQTLYSYSFFKKWIKMLLGSHYMVKYYRMISLYGHYIELKWATTRREIDVFGRFSRCLMLTHWCDVKTTDQYNTKHDKSVATKRRFILSCYCM